MTPDRAAGTRRLLTAAALLGICAVAFAVRSHGVWHVFTGPNEVILRSDDALYHARRARYGVANFPEVLERDAYLNHPHGAVVPWPPLYDLGLAAAARAAGGDEKALMGVLAWSSPVLGSATVLAVYAVARAVAPVGVGLGAAAIYAFLAASALYSGVGNPDHHAAVSLEGALLLAAFLWSLRSDVGRGTSVALLAALAPIRASLMLTWPGSLMYLGIGEPLFIAVAALAGKRNALLGYGVGGLACVALVVPWLWAGAGADAAFSGVELSWLHVTALSAAAIGALLVAAWEGARPASSARTRATRLLAVAAVLGLAVLAVPQLRTGVSAGLAFFGDAPGWLSGNFENVPIFEGGTARVALWLFGYMGFLIPVAPLAVLWRARTRRVREPAVMLAVWSAAFGALAIAYVRFGNDYAPAGAVALACTIAFAVDGLQRLRPFPAVARVAVALAIGVALLWPPLTRYRAALPRLLDFAERGPIPNYDQASFHRDLQHFAQRVRAATPETSGYLDSAVAPEYGILCFPAIGHAIVAVAERPATATNFGPYGGARGFLASNRYYAITSEDRAVAEAERMNVRYVVTSREGRPRRHHMLHRLHLRDGVGGEGVPPLSRFRLVTEWPAQGVALGWLSHNAPLVTPTPFKLFEIVRGAEFAVEGPPGSKLRVEVDVATTTGRRFTWAAEARVPEDGPARLRVPYATDPAETAADGPYRIRVDGQSIEVFVSNRQVLAGETIEVSPRFMDGTR